jgi:DNA-binding CsgD family transcriptional regulator
MSHGVLSKLIAERLQIAPKTVEVHRAHILRRLDVATSGEAIRLAIEAGL